MRSLIATTLVLSLAACAAPAPRLTPAPDPNAVLDAQLFPPYYGQVAVHLTKPAYIALFEVVPGRGVSLLYPRGGSGFQQTTQLWVPMQYNPQRWLYSSRYAASSGYYGYGARPYGGYSAFESNRGYYGPSAGYQGPPRYIFLVASEEPMELAQFQGSGTAIRSYLGAADYEGFFPYDVMERLAYAVLPFSSAERWASDVYVDWGYDWGYGAGPGQVAAMASYRTVRCPDGTLGSGRYVSGWGWDYPPCLNHATVTPQRPGVPPIGRPTPGDSAAPEPSGRGRSRDASADSIGRRRDMPAQETRKAPPATSAEMRQRIETLRAEAGDVRLRQRAASQLKRDVIRRQDATAWLREGTDRHEPRGSAVQGETPTRRRDAELQRRREEARRTAGGDDGPRSVQRAGSRDTRSTRQSESPRARPSTPPRAKAPASRGSSKPEASAPRTRSTAPAPKPQPTRTKQGTTRSRPPAL